MFNNLRTISILLITACSLTFFLFGFTIYHQDEFTITDAVVEARTAVCGTAFIDPYQIAPREFESTDTIRLVQVKKGERLFNANCRACHRMNQKLVGPALAGVFDRRDSVWIRTLIVDIDILIKRSDREVMKLRKEYNYTEHTRFTSLTKGELDDLIQYLKTDPGGHMVLESKVIACP